MANVVLQTAQLIRADGILLDPRGSIQTAATNGIRVHAGVDGLPVQPKAVVLDGRFSFPTLYEGAYTFRSDVLKDAAGRSVVFLGEAYITGQDVTPVTMSAIRTGAIAGSVRVPRVLNLAESLSVQIGADPQFDTRSLGPSPSVKIDRSLKFKIVAWPGANRIRARVENPGLYVKAIWLGGVDITDEVVTISDGVDLEGLELELTNINQTLSGRVASRADSDELVEDFAVVVFPVGRQLWGSPRRTVIAPVDQQGEFIVKSLPSGTYSVAMVPFSSAMNVRDPLFLEALQNTAQVVTLSEGSSAKVLLRR